MKLSHLLVLVFVATISSGLFVWVLSLAGVQASLPTLQWLSMPVGLFVALLVAWPISRLFGLSPLMIFAGPCPGCRTRPPGWWATQSGRQRVTLVCGACGERVELWLTRKPPAGFLSETGHVFSLRWPQFLGMWRQIR